MADTKFTKEQQSVIDHRGNSLLVSAAAGSGKTAVLVERILSRIREETDPVSLDELIVMTFTKAAASEMKGRIAEAIGKALASQDLSEELRARLETERTLLPRAMINTIDSICQRIIRQYFQLIDIDPGFRVADETELKLLRADIMKKLLEEKYEEASTNFLQLAQKFSGGGTEDRVSSLIEKLYFTASSEPWPDEFLARCRNDAVLEKNGEVEKTGWFEAVLRKEAEEAFELAGLAAFGLSLSTAPGGWLPYQELFEDLKAYYERIAGVFPPAAENASGSPASGSFGKDVWDSLHEIAMEDHKWKLSLARKVEGSSAEEKEREKAIIDILRDTEDFRKVFGISYDDLSQRAALSAADCETLSVLTEEFLSRLTEKKREMNIVDFSDMEHLCLELLYDRTDGKKKFSATADELARRYREIMIDEYQDSNDVQEQLIEALSAARFGRPDVFMVGDVKQSIYSFRGAKPGLFIRKHKGADNDVIELNKNFRSRPEVLFFVNDVFSAIMTEKTGGVDYDEAASLKTGRRDCLDGSGTPVFDPTGKSRTELLLLDTDSEKRAEYTDTELQCYMIADRIRDLTAPEDPGRVDYSDIAVLVRKNKLAETLVAVLADRGIPAHFDSGSGYFDSPEVKAMLSYLAVIDNPVQDIALASVMRHKLFGGFTDDELAMIRADADRDGVRGGFYDALKHAASGAADLSGKCAAFLEHISSLRDLSERAGCHELIWTIYRETGIYTHAASLPDGVRRRKNLDLLLEKAENYAGTDYHGLFNFNRYIEQLKKYDEDMGEAAAASEGENVVTVTTMHRSKGLQYPVVIAAFLEKNIRGAEKRDALKIDRTYGLSTDAVDLETRVKRRSVKSELIMSLENDSSVGEEMRLLYVAMTRAENKLILSAAGKLKSLPPLEKIAAAGSVFLSSDTADPSQPGMPGASSRKITAKEMNGAGSMLSMILMSGALLRGHAAVKVYERQNIDTTQITKETKENINTVSTETEINAENYAYREETTLKPKVSVSEIKEHTIKSIDEEFVRDLAEKRAVKGAAFGTKVHRIFEIFDYALPPEDAIGKAVSAVFPAPDAASAGAPAPGAVSSSSGRDPETVLASDLSVADISTPHGSSRTEDLKSREAALSIMRHFVQTPLYEIMRAASEKGTLRREQHFMAGFPACTLNDNVKSEELQIVQGIIDACIIEPDRLILIDYKTDSVSEADGERELKERYKIQLVLYATALAQLTRHRVEDACMLLYSTKLGRTIEI